jgi:nucleoside 2-deoxyribosyltransferase
MRVYLARSITGCTFEEVMAYYVETMGVLRGFGFEVLHPMCGKHYLGAEAGVLRAGGYAQPLSSNRAIVGRDRWMVKQSDVVLAYLSGARQVSIGTVCELAWAFDAGKHVIVVMESGNVHEHAFILQCADVVFGTIGEALAYLGKLAEGTV